MNQIFDPNHSLKKIALAENILIIQDIDGVCIPLVKDPLKRELEQKYIYAAASLKDEFAVLTCGEHEGRRGVNRIVERSMQRSGYDIAKDGLYLPGLAACGVELQDNHGNVSHPGLTEEEINFLRLVPEKMAILLQLRLKELIPTLKVEEADQLIKVAINDTRFTPTINLNEILGISPNDLNLNLKLQSMMIEIMNEILKEADRKELGESFHLHMMPNLGKSNGKEIMKYAKEGDIGTTDIQFIINGAFKEAGLLILLNEYIRSKTGNRPFGDNFNVKNAPKSSEELIRACAQNIPRSQMPLLIGVGDTVTSIKAKSEDGWLRGGSDRGFLSLIQDLGKEFNKENQIVFVNSSNDEVFRPTYNEETMQGVSDINDNLKFNIVFTGGSEEYISWFLKLSDMRTKSNII